MGRPFNLAYFPLVPRSMRALRPVESPLDGMHALPVSMLCRTENMCGAEKARKSLVRPLLISFLKAL